MVTACQHWMLPLLSMPTKHEIQSWIISYNATGPTIRPGGGACKATDSSPRPCECSSRLTNEIIFISLVKMMTMTMKTRTTTTVAMTTIMMQKRKQRDRERGGGERMEREGGREGKRAREETRRQQKTDEAAAEDRRRLPRCRPLCRTTAPQIPPPMCTCSWERGFTCGFTS